MINICQYFERHRNDNLVWVDLDGKILCLNHTKIITNDYDNNNDNDRYKKQQQAQLQVRLIKLLPTKRCFVQKYACTQNPKGLCTFNPSFS